MSPLKTIPRVTLDTYLKGVKLPLDFVAKRIGADGNGAATPAEIAIDRADAGVRSVAGTVLRDEALLEDATRRRVAADERAKALELRARAADRSEQADQQLDAREEAAEARRAAAAEQARKRKAKAEKERKEREARAKQAEQTRKAAARKSEQQAAERIASEERRAKLETLEKKSEALEEREEALTAADEAQRLADAAAKVKAERKAKARTTA
jgi:hypothetical protein